MSVTVRWARAQKSFFRRGIYLLCLLFIIPVISGCVSTIRSGLGDATPVSNTIDKKVWLSKVEILDLSGEDKSIAEESFTLNLLEYLQEGRYFKEVNLLPGKVGEDDLILRFRFDRFKEKYGVHPAYFPGALLTATLYIWVGGPCATMSSNLSGKLIVEDSHGSLITKVNYEVKGKRNFSIWTASEQGDFFSKPRTLIIKELLDRACATLQQRERQK